MRLSLSIQHYAYSLTETLYIIYTYCEKVIIYLLIDYNINNIDIYLKLKEYIKKLDLSSLT